MENNIDNLLVELGACDEAKEWAKGKSWPEIYKTCHRGDWLLWLFQSTNPDDIKLLTLAKGHCANTVRHLMKDDRSIKAVDAAISFGEGKIGLDGLNAAAAAATGRSADYAAYAAFYSASYVAASHTSAAYAAVAVYSSAYAASAADAADAADASADAADADAADAEKKNQEETADICRKYLPIEIWNIKYFNISLTR